MILVPIHLIAERNGVTPKSAAAQREFGDRLGATD